MIEFSTETGGLIATGNEGECCDYTVENTQWDFLHSNMLHL